MESRVDELERAIASGTQLQKALATRLEAEEAWQEKSL